MLYCVQVCGKQVVRAEIVDLSMVEFVELIGKRIEIFNKPFTYGKIYSGEAVLFYIEETNLAGAVMAVQVHLL